MKLEITVAFFSALSLGLCLFLGVLCWIRGKSEPPLRWLAILLCVLSLRLLKSVLTVAAPSTAFPAAVLSLASAALIGPLAWCYVRSLQPKNPNFEKQLFWHFLAAPFLAAAWVYWLEQIPANWFFGVANALTFSYLSAAAIWAHKHRDKLMMPVKWLKGFLVGMTLFALIFLLLMFCQNEGRTYLLVTSLAAVVLYGLSFWAIRHFRLSKTLSRKLPDESLAATFRNMGIQVEILFETEQTYTDTSLTIHKLAQQMKQQPYQLSKAVNFHFGKSFPELLAQHRVRHAEQLLVSPAAERFSIDAIAYESGFASLSAFYVAFKKQYGSTPAEYRKRFAVFGTCEK